MIAGYLLIGVVMLIPSLVHSYKDSWQYAYELLWALLTIVSNGIAIYAIKMIVNILLKYDR